MGLGNLSIPNGPQPRTVGSSPQARVKAQNQAPVFFVCDAFITVHVARNAIPELDLPRVGQSEHFVGAMQLPELAPEQLQVVTALLQRVELPPKAQKLVELATTL